MCDGCVAELQRGYCQHDLSTCSLPLIMIKKDDDVIHAFIERARESERDRERKRERAREGESEIERE